MYIKFTKWHVLSLQRNITISIIIFIVISNNISVQFVEIKCAEDDHTLQTVNTEFGEKTTSRFSYLPVQCKHKQNHMETLSRVPCKQRLPTWTHARYSLVEKGPVALTYVVSQNVPPALGQHTIRNDQ